MARTKKTASDWNTTPVWIYDYDNDSYYKAIRHMIVNNNECVFAEVTALYDCDDETGEPNMETYKEMSPRFYEICLNEKFATISINENFSALASLIVKEYQRIQTETQCRKENLINDIIDKLTDYSNNFSRDEFRDRIKGKADIEYLLSDIHSNLYSPYKNSQEIASIINKGGIDIRQEDRDDAPRIFIPFSKIIEVSSYTIREVRYISFVRSDGKTISLKSTDYLLRLREAIHFLWYNKVRL